VISTKNNLSLSRTISICKTLFAFLLETPKFCMLCCMFQTIPLSRHFFKLRLSKKQKQTAGSEVGADTNLCMQTLAPQGYSDAQVQMSIQYLLGKGHIYSTIGGNEWQAY